MFHYDGSVCVTSVRSSDRGRIFRGSIVPRYDRYFIQQILELFTEALSAMYRQLNEKKGDGYGVSA